MPPSAWHRKRSLGERRKIKAICAKCGKDFQKIWRIAYSGEYNEQKADSQNPIPASLEGPSSHCLVFVLTHNRAGLEGLCHMLERITAVKKCERCGVCCLLDPCAYIQSVHGDLASCPVLSFDVRGIATCGLVTELGGKGFGIGEGCEFPETARTRLASPIREFKQHIKRLSRAERVEAQDG